ncbi:MAG: phospholipase A [bacterium]|nr:phospholipase A [bacterium]
MKKRLALFWLAASAMAGASEPVAVFSAQEQQRLLAAATPQADRGISAHEPVYFLLEDNWRGEGDSGLKFQVSLKYRLFSPEEEKKPQWWERVYFAYTQTSVMDIEAGSKPFRDSAYRPEVFWDQPDFSLLPSVQTLASMRAGIGHESNGRDGTDSRSINIAYVRPTFTFTTSQHGYVWSFAPKLYAYLDRSDNPDIADYRGYGDFLVKLKKDDTWEYVLMLRKGMKAAYGSTQMDVSYPFRGFLRNVNGYVYFQYFNGYGETILDYNIKQPSRIGLGLIVVR